MISTVGTKAPLTSGSTTTINVLAFFDVRPLTVGKLVRVYVWPARGPL